MGTYEWKLTSQSLGKFTLYTQHVPLQTVAIIPKAPIGAMLATNVCLLFDTCWVSDRAESAPTSVARGEKDSNASERICCRSEEFMRTGSVEREYKS